MAILEIGSLARRIVESTQSRENHALIVAVDFLVTNIAYSTSIAAVGAPAPAGDVEAVDVETKVVGHTAMFEPVVGSDSSGEVASIMGFGRKIGVRVFMSGGSREWRCIVIARKV